MFATMAYLMNFTPKLLIPHMGRHGFPLPNGTSIIALGDVIYTCTDISFCSRFIKHYNTTDIEYFNSILSDKMCIIVPKVKPFPHWRRMLLSFNSESW
jgi:hypothetical protein